MMLLGKGADPAAASENNAHRALRRPELRVGAKALYPQPRAQMNQKATYLELMKALLDKGADPNVRLNKKSGTPATASICPAWTRPARRRSGAQPTPATSTR